MNTLLKLIKRVHILLSKSVKNLNIIRSNIINNTPITGINYE